MVDVDKLYDQLCEIRYNEELRYKGDFDGEVELNHIRDAIPVFEKELHENEVYFREDGWPEDEMPDSVIELRDRLDMLRSRQIILEKEEERCHSRLRELYGPDWENIHYGF